MKKTIEVVAAIIVKNNKVFICKRGKGRNLEGYYEFPGGKIEKNETQKEALIREVKEELQSEISVDQFFMTIDYDYDDFHLKMHTYLCTLLRGDLVLLEHTDKAWCEFNELDEYEFPPANKKIIEKLKKLK